MPRDSGYLCIFAEWDLFCHWYPGPDMFFSLRYETVPLVHWMPFWLWPKGQKFLLRYQKKGTLTGNLATTFHKFYYFSAVSADTLLLFFNENILFIKMQGSICYSLTWKMLLYFFQLSTSGFCKEKPHSPKKIMNNVFDFLFFVSIFFYCSFSSLQLYKSTFLHKVLKMLMHGDHMWLYYNFIKKFFLGLHVWT